MMEEISLKTIEWQAPEYSHKKRSVDYLWTIGLIAVVVAVVAVILASYIFAIFVLVSGACLIMFTLREPQMFSFVIKTEGFFMGKDMYEWKKLKGFTIIDSKPDAKLLIETSKYFLPVYTIPLPSNLKQEVKEELSKAIPVLELKESPSMAFAEKIGL